MSDRTSPRILSFAALAVVLAAVSVVGQMDWRRVSPTNIPYSNRCWCMAYDGARQRVVLSGGYGGIVSNETWQWDGRTWTRRNSKTNPPTCLWPAMAYDAARQQAVFFGGPSNAGGETWLWDGSNWTQRKPKTTPPASSGHAMAYDAARQQVVLFGGYGDSDETWVWDGSDWTRCNPKTSPPGRNYSHAMAYDAARQRVVLFGGRYLTDTWEWDGRDWIQCNPTTSPSGGARNLMAYDAARQRVVFFGGYYQNETWEWDGKNWTKRNPATPPPIPGYSMAYDAARQRVVLFGGLYRNETWEWDGSNWKDVSPVTNTPPQRTRQALVHDRAGKRMVLFGGRGGTPSFPSFGDTWEWDGNAWTQSTLVAGPSVRDSHAMAHDAARRRTVLFGGRAQGGTLLNDTWEWNGSNWTRRNPATSPPARYVHAMVYDAARLRIVLFGGSTGWTMNALNDTWEWSGTNWTRLNPVSSPPARSDHAMAYDAARQRIVLFGGIGGPPNFAQLNDTWEWDGWTWTQLNPPTSPSVRYGHGLAYDRARQRTVLFGGESWGPSPHQKAPDYHGDTWEWDGKTWTKSSCPLSPWGRSYHSMAYDPVRGSVIVFGGGGGAPAADTLAYSPTDLTASTHLVSVGTGGNVRLSVDAGAAHAAKNYWILGCYDVDSPRGIPTLKIDLRLNPDPYFWLTAQVPNPLMPNSLGRLDAAGRATATLLVPKGLPATLVGTRFIHAYVVFQSRIDYASAPVPLTLVP